MDKYRKGKNVEEQMTREGLPLEALPEDALWLRVRGGTKIYAVLEPALQQLRSGRTVVWSGSGPAIRKAISCAELCKQKLGYSLHQITKLAWLQCDEHWEPLVDGLDELIVRRRVPAVHMLLSCEPLNTQTSGYQPPGREEPFKHQIAQLNFKRAPQ